MPALAKDLAGVPAAIEQLLKAQDSASVLEACARILEDLGIAGRLHWQPLASPGVESHGWRHELAEDVQHQLVLVLSHDEPVALPLRGKLAWLGRLADARLNQLSESSRLYEAISRLALAERLQRALYAIAEQASAEQDMPALMRSLHTIVSSLMYAENFYIALYDAASDSVRFPYYVDSLDVDVPSPERSVPLNELLHGVTWNLLRRGRPLFGAIDELAQELGGQFQLHGTRCEHCIGVPLFRSGQVVGCIVVQSYRAKMRYTRHDLDLLSYVAQHVQTTIERRGAHVELERRVADRTTALREANRVLRQQVLQRQRGERLQAALFRIAELAGTTDSLDDFYPAVHRVIGGLLYARNLYIALIDEETQFITFPYSVDEMNSERPPRRRGGGATEYVQRTGKPLLADMATIDRLIASGEIVNPGARSVCWLGVPLSWADKVRGVLAVQSYSPEHTYSERDQELLTFVSYHVANALQRKHADATLKQAYASLERRVVERTRALGLANRDLREQIAERERIERRLKYETLHDSLTGLPNRTMLLQRLEQALQHYLANPKDGFAVLFIDLDRFKVINDSVGHLVGDDLLFQVGGRIRACLKTRDIVARLGGDEFAVLLEQVPDVAAAQRTAERVLKELQAPFRLGTREIFTSASIGIAMADTHYRQPEELLRDADSAMYHAKDGGRHRASLFDDRLRHEALSQLRMEGDLRHALARREFVPFYQPIVSLADGCIAGYEALLRWNHPERGLLLPHDFLLIAEETGCAEAIDWLVFEQVCAQAMQLLGGKGTISINVSGLHFRSDDFDARLLALLDKYHVPPSSIRVEVIERTLLDNPAQVKRMLENLRLQGMGIALDDFGTGYSSLSYLHQYPFDALKIDRSFVTELDSDRKGQGAAVIRAIQVLADALSMQVIAEGIENTAQQQALLDMGCRYGQGFLFARGQAAEYWLRPENRLP
ncbi:MULTISPECIES: EAL domain-containing protein [Rhodanobacter]|nr:EAL domain-containing protein [Rhodanobacter sp. 7MK24]